MADDSNWTNAQFHQAIASAEPAYVNCLNSYTEQRDIAAREGLRYLGTHPLAQNITARMAVCPGFSSALGSLVFFLVRECFCFLPFALVA
jgi:hypothetical protein